MFSSYIGSLFVNMQTYLNPIPGTTDPKGTRACVGIKSLRCLWALLELLFASLCS